jgi:hypothetical protein
MGDAGEGRVWPGRRAAAWMAHAGRLPANPNIHAEAAEVCAALFPV